MSDGLPAVGRRGVNMECNMEYLGICKISILFQVIFGEIIWYDYRFRLPIYPGMIYITVITIDQFEAPQTFFSPLETSMAVIAVCFVLFYFIHLFLFIYYLFIYLFKFFIYYYYFFFSIMAIAYFFGRQTKQLRLGRETRAVALWSIQPLSHWCLMRRSPFPKFVLVPARGQGPYPMYGHRIDS